MIQNKNVDSIDTITSKSNSYGASIVISIKTIRNLLKQGYKLIWSLNNNWCTINNQNFNINKEVWDFYN